MGRAGPAVRWQLFDSFRVWGDATFRTPHPSKSPQKNEEFMAEPFKGERSEKAAVTLSGTVEKIIKPISPPAPEKAQISVHGSEDLYREIRIEILYRTTLDIL
jgi:hypothetical protein